MVGRPPRRIAARLALGRSDWWGVGAIILTAIILFAPVWLQGQVWIDGDLGDFYWPTMLTAFGKLRQGDAPLWTPGMFGGFPLFADGSIGTLFPLNWLLLAWPHGLMLIPFGRMLLAALGMYLFLRTLRVGALGATVGGLVFALNGFAVSHFSHIDLNNGTAMLPYTLWAAERSRWAVGWRRQGLWLLVAGLAHGLAWVSLHPMAPLMILPVYAGWVVYRGLMNPSPTPYPNKGEGNSRGEVTSPLPTSPLPTFSWEMIRGRVLAGWRWPLAALVLPLVLALGLAAAQLLPMLELGDLSPRQTAGARFNASFSLPPYNLIGLVWPTFFHSAPGGPQWGLWNLETLVYLGTLPLVLALLALTVRPAGRHVAFFALTGFLALWTAFAVYAPLSPQPLLYSLPGYNVLRAPARFFYLTAFAGAYLAAIGVDWLQTLNPPTPPHTARIRREIGGWGAGREWRRVTWLLRGLVVVAVLLPLIAIPILLFVNLVPQQAERAIWAFYLRLLHGTPLRYEDVVFALNQKLNPLNPEMWKAVGLLLASVGLIWAWLRGWLTQRAFGLVVVILVAGDLLYLANQYVTPVPLERVTEPRPAATFMRQDREQWAASTLNGDRFFHTKPVDPPMTDLPHGLRDFHGQSSLNMARPAAYIAAALKTETRLLDLASVRYLLVPNNLPDTRRRYAGVAFDRDQPLIVIDSQSPDYLRTFAPGGPAREVRLILALSQAVDAPQGETVAEVVVTGPSGEQTFPIRAGIEAAEWAFDRPDVRAVVKHERPTPVHSWSVRDETGQQFDRHLFYVAWPLSETPGTIQSLQFNVTQPELEVRVFGVAIVGDSAPALVNLTRYDLTRYTLAYTDAEAQIYTSQTALPRAFLVGQAAHYDQRWQALERLEAGLDPTRVMTVEGQIPPEAAGLVVAGPLNPRQALPPAPDPATLGRLTLVKDKARRVTLRAETTAPAFLVLSDTFYPGWQARVDEAPTPILLANYNFRAVYLPPGDHQVTFAFGPSSVGLGGIISLSTVIIMLCATVVLFRIR